MSSKKEKRLEKKKRKLEVYLQLTEDNNDQADRKKLKCQTEFDSTSGTVQDVKKQNGGLSCPEEIGKSDKSMPAAELAELRARLREKQKAAMQAPKIFLTLDKLTPTVDTERQYKSNNCTGQPALFLVDLQHLLLFAAIGSASSFKPRWCNLIRCGKVSKVLLIVVDGVSSQHFEENIDCFPFVKEKFSLAVDMKNPYQFSQTAAGELFRVPVSKRAMYLGDETCKIFSIQEKVSKNDSLDKKGDKKEKKENNKEEEKIKEKERESKKISETVCDSFPRVDLLMNVEQMIMDNYPLPSVNQEKIKGYIFTKSEYQPVSNKSPLFAIDCEMCQTSVNQSELTRVAVVDENRRCLIDRLVKPRNPITNYLTRYSGITKEMLENVTTRIEDVQREIRDLLPSDAILVGQSFNHDLHALKMFHPYIIDTSLIYNLSGDRSRRTNLKTLTSFFLKREIQTRGKLGHNPWEDALASLDLVLLKLQKGIDFGDVTMKPLQVDFDSKPGSSSTSAIKTDSEVTSNESEKTKKGSVKKMSNGQGDCSTEMQHSNPRHSSGPSGDSRSSNGADIKKQFYSVASASTQYRDFFELVRNSKKSVAAGGFGDSLPQKGCVYKLNDDSDKQLISSCKQAMSHHDMICAQLNSFSHRRADSDVQGALQKIDKRIRKLMKAVDANALVTVVLAGDHSEYNNAKCFVAIT